MVTPAARPRRALVRRISRIAAASFVVAACAAAWIVQPASALATTTLALSVDPNPARAGEQVTLTATVSSGGGVPVGKTVNFSDGGVTFGAATVAGDGTATLAVAFTPGTHTVQATFPIQNPYLPSSSPTVTLVVTAAGDTKSSTSIALSGDSSIQSGASARFVATVAASGSAPAPTGTVEFYDNGAVIGDASLDAGTQTATLSASGFAEGTHSITAKYLGDARNAPSSLSNALMLTVTAPPSAVDTAITAGIDPAVIPEGGSAVLAAHVQQVGATTTPPSGEIVTFRNDADNSLIAQGALDANGDVRIVKTGWQPGRYTIRATYVGDLSFKSASATFSVDVRAVAPLTVTAPSPTIVYGDPLPSLTPSYSGFVDGDGPGSLDVQPTCTASAPTPPPAGTYPITCSGASDPFYTLTYVPGTLTVRKAPLTVTPDDVTIHQGDPIPPLTASLSGFVNGETLATSGVTGQADCTTTATSSSPPGAYPITCTVGTLAAANYTFAVSSAPGTLTIAARGTRHATAVPWVVALPQGARATLLGSLFDGFFPLAGRTLTLTFGSQSCTGTTNWLGLAACEIVVSDPVGPTTSTASFAGDDRYAPASTALPAYVYAFPGGGGAFVIGDRSAFGSGSVTFWGAQWAKENRLSGGDAPKSFKGFAAQPATSQVGATWSTGPGDSPSPPGGPLPAYMGVIVTGSARKSGSSIGGSTDALAIVRTDTGYAPDPGHAGTGTVVAVVDGHGIAVGSLGLPLLASTGAPSHDDDRSRSEGDSRSSWSPPRPGRGGHRHPRPA
ncbi:MAG: Ig-like domain repeat protein [Thermoleophilia bacterium]|nr:Ig-like domain repeat protein [Thermoleophilia bacterium]